MIKANLGINVDFLPWATMLIQSVYSCTSNQAFRRLDIYFVGNSMGGYAALLFFAMLQLGKAIVFSPQMFLGPEKRRFYGDDRWAEKIKNLHETHASSDIPELKPWIQYRFPHMSARVYVSTSDALDMYHVDELAVFFQY